MSRTKVKHRSADNDDTEAHWIACQKEHSIECLQAITESRYAWATYLRSDAYRQLNEQCSCDYSLLGSRFAKHIGLVKWSAVGKFFDLLDDFPHITRDVRDYFVQRGGVRLWWTDRFERIELSGWFILIPTSAVPDGAIDPKLQAYREQSARIPLKEIDVINYCRNFEKYTKPIGSRNETDEERELRLLIRLSAIIDFARAQVAKISASIAS